MVEEVLDPEAGTTYPRCLAGRRRCPPEDVGGIGGYNHFLEAIGDDKHPGHATYLEWIGGPFDPEAFDLTQVNQDLGQIRWTNRDGNDERIKT